MAYAYDHFPRSLLTEDLAFHAGPRPGEALPDFAVRDLDGELVHLRDIQGDRPLLLVFGSVTCPMTRDADTILHRLHREFGDRVRFVTLYIREAHPGEHYPQPRTLDEKLANARALRDRDRIEWPVLVDDVEGTVHQELDPKPASAYLVGADGTVLFRMLWANYERPLRRALQAVADGAVGLLGERHDRLVPMVRGWMRTREVLAAAGPAAQRDMLREAPPVYALAWVLDRARRRPVATALVALGLLGVGTVAASRWRATR